MPRKKITTDSTFRGLLINTGKDNSLGCNIRILDAAYNLLDNYTRAHSQVLVVHLCLTFGFGYTDHTNNSLQKFMNNYTRDLDRRGMIQVSCGAVNRIWQRHNITILQCWLIVIRFKVRKPLRG